MDDREAYLNLADEFDLMGATVPAVLSDFDPDVVAAARRYAETNGVPLPWDLRSVDVASQYVSAVDRRADRQPEPTPAWDR